MVKAQRQRQRGQGLVEFALILPLLLLLMVGVIEFGRLLFMYTEVSNAAREAVRYGIARGTDVSGDPRYLDCAGIAHAGQVSTALTPLAGEDFTIEYDSGGGTPYGACGEGGATVDFGDRLVVTVSHSIQPLILFQDAGPFNVQFTAARTIIQEGIPMAEPEDKHDDGVDGLPDPPPGVTDLVLNYIDSYSCQIQLAWSLVEGATEYEVYLDGVGEIALVSSPPYPPSGSLSTSNGDIFYVRSAHADGESPMSNKVTVSGCGVIPSPEDVQFVVDDPAVCQGYLAWDPVVGVTVDGYHVYDDGGSLLATVTDTRYPEVGSLSSANGQEFQVRASLGSAEGDPVSVYVAGCVPAAPTGLTFVLDQVSSPCQGHFYWAPATDAEGYYLYQNGSLIATLTGTRYPAISGSVAVTSGDQYAVSAYAAAGESALSSSVTVSGCPVPGEPVDVVYYLHSNPTPPVWHTNAPPPLTMNETAPAHPVLYNYNSTDDTKPGREVSPGGGDAAGGNHRVRVFRVAF